MIAFSDCCLDDSMKGAVLVANRHLPQCFEVMGGKKNLTLGPWDAMFFQWIFQVLVMGGR